MTAKFLSRTITRRQFALGTAAGAAALTLLPAHSIFAAAAQSTSGLASLGYPELKITITDTAFEGVPDSTPAGRYLLTATAKVSEKGGNQQPPGIAFLSGTPVGMSANDVLNGLLAPAATPAAASPAQQAVGTPQASGDQQLPLIVYQLHFTGGALIFGSGTQQAVIDLTPGEYLAWADDPTAPQKPVPMKVTGDFPKDVKDPQADITATLLDFAIQMEGSLTAGKHIIKVQHHGAQPHFLELDKGPDSMTKEQAQAALAGEMSGTPVAGGLSQNDLQPAFFSPTQSIGTTTWHPVELQAGTYLAACFFPTAGTGVPHAMNGMIDVFKVTG